MIYYNLLCRPAGLLKLYVYVLYLTALLQNRYQLKFKFYNVALPVNLQSVFLIWRLNGLYNLEWSNI